MHADGDRAARELTEVLTDHVRAGGRVADLTASIVERTVGDRHLGKSVFVTGEELPAVSEAAGLAAAQLVDLGEVLEHHTSTSDPVNLDAIGAAAEPKPRSHRFWRRH
ncbi:hypothetical protein [Nocardia salmonicida]|uniref:hypothetical protein n=1 Tax=Nocardia salmonicida TaxID=53431 RepID=UPI003CFB8EDE